MTDKSVEKSSNQACLENVLKRLQRRMLDLDLKPTAVAKKAGLGKGTVLELLNGRNKNPGLLTLAAIAEALDTSLETLIETGISTSLSNGMIRGPRAALAEKTILLVISGGIAAYKTLDLIRRLRENGATVRAVMTRAAREFVTPLSVGALTGGKVFTELFDRDDEHDIGHIRLSREADLIVVAPATADLLARMAGGHADDLATAVLLVTDTPVLVAPAMNPRMWHHKATRRNVEVLRQDGIGFVGPNSGEMAEANEAGSGRMAEPLEILAAVVQFLEPADTPLAGKHVLITSGPTHEPIDPVRYLANRSSGRQGHAIAVAAAAAGARVTLVSGPVELADPDGVHTVHVETARQMRDAVTAALPADVAIMAAAVADWRVARESHGKIKKDGSGSPAALELVENPDILATIGRHQSARPPNFNFQL